MELSADTGRADAPLHAICRWNGGKLWPEKSCAGRTSLVREACLSGKKCGFVCLKEITHGKSCCLCFIGQHCLWDVLLRPSLPSAIYLSCFLISIYGRSFGPTCPYGSRYMILPFAWWVARTSTSAICTCAGAEAA